VLEARHGLEFIISDLIQNWLAASIACPIKMRPILYRIAGNKIGRGCYLSPQLFHGLGPGNLTVGGLLYITSVGLIWEIILSLEKTAILP